MPQFMIIFFIIISAVENSSIENSLKTEYWNFDILYLKKLTTYFLGSEFFHCL
jgi:hypothetical protein